MYWFNPGRPFITERLLMGRKESNQTKKDKNDTQLAARKTRAEHCILFLSLFCTIKAIIYIHSMESMILSTSIYRASKSLIRLPYQRRRFCPCILLPVFKFPAAEATTEEGLNIVLRANTSPCILPLLKHVTRIHTKAKTHK